MGSFTFKKAVKREAKGRVAFVGPAGSGKTYTMLALARALAGPGGKIAAIDTEHGSLSKYADLFEFDVIELASYSTDAFLECLDAAEHAGYSVFCCDSLSHFWMGKDGALEFVDERKKRTRDQMEGWKDFRPHERAMVDRIISSRLHVICTMRTKNEYVTEEYTDSQGKKKTKRTKVGLAPVQREGLEYEFDLVMTLNDDNEAIVDKTRCSHYAGKVIAKPGAKEFQPFIEWLKGAPADRPSERPQQQQQAPNGTASGASEPKANGNGNGNGVPAESTAVQALFARCKDDQGRWSRFAFAKAGGELKKDIEELCGNPVPYYETLAGFEMQHFGPDDMKGKSPSFLCAVIKALYLKCEAIRASAEEDFAPDPEPQVDEATRRAMEFAEAANNV